MTMAACKVIFKIIRLILKPFVLILQMILTIISITIGFLGGIAMIVGCIIGALLVIFSVFGLMTGQELDSSFYSMFICGVCLGVIPTTLQVWGQKGIGMLKGLLMRV